MLELLPSFLILCYFHKNLLHALVKVSTKPPGSGSEYEPTREWWLGWGGEGREEGEELQLGYIYFTLNHSSVWSLHLIVELWTYDIYINNRIFQLTYHCSSLGSLKLDAKGSFSPVAAWLGWTLCTSCSKSGGPCKMKSLSFVSCFGLPSLLFLIP